MVWGVGLTGLWHTASLALSDRMHQWSTHFIDTDFQVLLLEGGREAFSTSSKEWQELMDRLMALGAVQVVLLDMPANADTEFIKHAKDIGKVIVGKHLIYSTSGSTTLTLEHTLDEANLLPFGILYPGPSTNGIHRHQTFSFSVDGVGAIPTVEALAAKLKDGNALASSEMNSFLINFSTTQDNLPRIRLEQALKGNLVKELITGQSVVIALDERPVGTGLHTPITSNERLMSPAEFHSFALNTLLTGSMIQESTTGIALIVSIITAFLALVSYHKLPDQWSFGVAIGGIAVYLLLGWAALIFINYSMPIFEAIAAHILGLTVMLHRRRRNIRNRIIRLLRRLSGRLQQQYVAQNFYESEEHWDQIINLVSQMLHMQRIIFLERVV